MGSFADGETRSRGTRNWRDLRFGDEGNAGIKTERKQKLKKVNKRKTRT